jgi:hypothetical protein
VAPSLGDQLVQLSDRLSAVGARADDASFSEPLRALLAAAEQVGVSWSHSSIGYHALVYYTGLQVPPPGAHFSQEWGFSGTFQGTTGDWREYQHDDVIRQIEGMAGKPDLAPLREEARAAESVFRVPRCARRRFVDVARRAAKDR